MRYASSFVPADAAHAAGAMEPLARAVHRALRVNLLGVRGLTPLRVGGTVVVVLLFSLWSTTANMIARGSPRDIADALRQFPLMYAIYFFPAMIAATIADALPMRGAPRIAALIVALALAAVLVVPLDRYFIGCHGDCTPFPGPWAIMESASAILWVFVHTSAIALVYFFRRSDQATAALLHASEIAIVDAERARLESLLQRMQARVDPAFLLETLRDIGGRCETDQGSGTRLLDSLIRYLRAALPSARSTGSTFAREGEMLRSFLDIAALRSEGGLAIACRYDDALANAGFPPMILVPLVAAIEPAAGLAGRVDVDARAIDGRVRVTIAADGTAARRVADTPAIAEVRKRLREIHGDRASFAVDRAPAGAARLILEIPLRSVAPSGDRTARKIPAPGSVS